MQISEKLLSLHTITSRRQAHPAAKLDSVYAEGVIDHVSAE